MEKVLGKLPAGVLDDARANLAEYGVVDPEQALVNQLGYVWHRHGPEAAKKQARNAAEALAAGQTLAARVHPTGQVREDAVREPLLPELTLADGLSAQSAEVSGQQDAPGPPLEELSSAHYIWASGIVSRYGWLPMPGSRESTAATRDIQRYVHEEVARALAVFGEEAAHARAMALTLEYGFESPRGLAGGVELRPTDLSPEARKRLRDLIRELGAHSPPEYSLNQLGKDAVDKLRADGDIPESVPGTVTSRYVRSVLGHVVKLDNLPDRVVEQIRERYLELRASGTPRTVAAVQAVTELRAETVIPAAVTGSRIGARRSRRWDIDAAGSGETRPLRLVSPDRYLRVTDLSSEARELLRERTRELHSATPGELSVNRAAARAIAQLRVDRVIPASVPGTQLPSEYAQRMVGAFVLLGDLRKPGAVEQLRDHYLTLRGAGFRHREAASRAVAALRRKGVIPADVTGTTIPLTYGIRWQRQASGTEMWSGEGDLPDGLSDEVVDLSPEELAGLDGFLDGVGFDVDGLLTGAVHHGDDGLSAQEQEVVPGAGDGVEGSRGAGSEGRGALPFEASPPGWLEGQASGTEAWSGEGDLPDGLSDEVVDLSPEELAGLDGLVGGLSFDLGGILARTEHHRSDVRDIPDEEVESGPADAVGGSSGAGSEGGGDLSSAGGVLSGGVDGGGMPTPVERWQAVVAAASVGALSWEAVATAQVPVPMVARISIWAGWDAVTTLRAWHADGLPVFGSSVPGGSLEGEQVLVTFPAGASYDLGMLDGGRPDGTLVVPGIGDQFRIISILADHPEPGTTMVVLGTEQYGPETVAAGPWPPWEDLVGDTAATGMDPAWGSVGPTSGPSDQSAGGHGAGSQEGAVPDIVPDSRQLEDVLGGRVDLGSLPLTVEAASRAVTELKQLEMIPAGVAETTLRLSVRHDWERVAQAAQDNASHPGPAHGNLRVTELPPAVRQYLDDSIRALATHDDGMDASEIARKAVAQLRADDLIPATTPGTLQVGYVKNLLGHFVDLKGLPDAQVERIREHYLALRNNGLRQVVASSRVVTELRKDGMIPAEVGGNTIRPDTAFYWERTAGSGASSSGPARSARRASRQPHPYRRGPGLTSEMRERPDSPIRERAADRTEAADHHRLGRQADAGTTHDDAGHAGPGHQFLRVTKLPPAVRQYLDDSIRALATHDDGMDASEIARKAVAQLRADGLIPATTPGTLQGKYVQRLLGHIVELKRLPDAMVERLRERYLALRQEGVPARMARSQAVTELREEGVIPPEVAGTVLDASTGHFWQAEARRPGGTSRARPRRPRGPGAKAARSAASRPDNTITLTSEPVHSRKGTTTRAQAHGAKEWPSLRTAGNGPSRPLLASKAPQEAEAWLPEEVVTEPERALTVVPRPPSTVSHDQPEGTPNTVQPVADTASPSVALPDSGADARATSKSEHRADEPNIPAAEKTALPGTGSGGRSTLDPKSGTKVGPAGGEAEKYGNSVLRDGPNYQQEIDDQRDARGLDRAEHDKLRLTATNDLSEAQARQVVEVRDAIKIGKGRTVTKVVKPEVAQAYLENATELGTRRFNPRGFGGSVARGSDTADLRSLDQLRNGLALDDGGAGWTPLPPGASEAYQLRFPAPHSMRAEPTLGAVGDQGLADRIAGMAGQNPGRAWDDPFLGTGYTGGGLPEWDAKPTDFPHHAEIWRMHADGTEEAVGYFDKNEGLWKYYE
ncbi:hypothetical protein [Kitasatospora indigofera]|uniref:hypothetical protein n=1 Tax=Kitasatospora indigofera TaxID=67307 RepID=UPI0033BBDDB3